MYFNVVCYGLNIGLVEEVKVGIPNLFSSVSQIVHVRWSGEGVWIPLGDLDFGVGYENHTSYPAPGQIILYPGGISETEILLAYGGVQFACKMGQLAGNHFITLTSGLEKLPEIGKLALWKGAQSITFKAA